MKPNYKALSKKYRNDIERLRVDIGELLDSLDEKVSAIEKLEFELDAWKRKYYRVFNEYIEANERIERMDVRHGEWGFDGLGWTCSACGEYALTNKAKMQVHSRHCPHCGAKMDGERREG